MSTLRTTTLKHGGSTILDNLVLSNAGETRFCPNSSFGRAALYVDGQTNRVGVNTESPGVALDVDGAINATGNVVFGGTLSATGDVVFGGSASFAGGKFTINSQGSFFVNTDRIIGAQDGQLTVRRDVAGAAFYCGTTSDPQRIILSNDGSARFAGGDGINDDSSAGINASGTLQIRQDNGVANVIQVRSGNASTVTSFLTADGWLRIDELSVGTTTSRSPVDVQDGTDTTQVSIGTSPQFGSSQTDTTLQLTGNQGDGSGPSICFHEQNAGSLSTTGRGARIQSVRANRSSNRQMKLAVRAANNDGTTVQGLEVGAYQIDAYINNNHSLSILNNKVLLGTERDSGSSSSTGSIPQGGVTKTGYGGYVISHYDALVQNGTLTLTIDNISSAIYSGMLSITSANRTAGADRVSRLYFVAYSNQYQVQTLNIIDEVSAGSSPPTFTVTLASSGRIIITNTDSRETEYCATFMGSCV